MRIDRDDETQIETILYILLYMHKETAEVGLSQEGTYLPPGSERHPVLIVEEEIIKKVLLFEFCLV